MLKCSVCGEVKPDDCFYRGQARSTGRRGRSSACKDCRRQIPQKPWPASKQRRHHLKVTYGITVERFDEMLSDQDGCCAICRTTAPGGKGWCVDHDHASGLVRSILCNGCNTGIGFLRESPELLRAAADYLELALLTD